MEKNQQLDQNKTMDIEDHSLRKEINERNHTIRSSKLQYISRDNKAMQEELIQQVIQTQNQLGISFGRALLLITRMNISGQTKSTKKQHGNELLNHIYIDWNSTKLQAQTNGKQCLLCLEDLKDEDTWEELKEEEEEKDQENQILDCQSILDFSGFKPIELIGEMKRNSDESVIQDKDSVISINSKSDLEISDENMMEQNINQWICYLHKPDICVIDLEIQQQEDKTINEKEKKKCNDKQGEMTRQINDTFNSGNIQEMIIDKQVKDVVLEDIPEEKPIPMVLKKKKYALGCNHFFCGNCFEAYVKAIFQEGQSCIYKTCPLDGCLERLGRDDFKNYLTAKQLLIYDKFIFTSMLQSSDTAIQCPASGCDLVQVALADTQTLKNRQECITCQCQYEYCNLCRERSHFPSDCQDFKKWITKLEIEGVGSLNDQWIIMNTKPCPKCNVNIEKNQGCLHMTCKPCGHHFCWMCLGEWKSHTDYYNCTKFDADKLKEQENKKKELSRFRFHSGHYDTHQANVIAVKHEISFLLEGITNVNQQLIANNMKPIETKNIEQFCDLILKARKYLPYLYAKGYFITDAEKLEFFNNLLEDYVRILDIYNKNLENFQSIIECTNPRLTIKTSFYMALHSLPKKINSLENYISRQTYQFTKGLEHLEQVKKRTVTSIPENTHTIFEMKKRKVAAKEKENALFDKKMEKIALKEQEKQLNNKQRNQITIFIDSDSDNDNEEITQKNVGSDEKSSLSNSEERQLDNRTKKQENQMVLRKSEMTNNAPPSADEFPSFQSKSQFLKLLPECSSITKELLNSTNDEDYLEEKKTRLQQEEYFEQLKKERQKIHELMQSSRQDAISESESDSDEETAVFFGASKRKSKVRISKENKQKNKVIQRKRIRLEEKEEEEEEVELKDFDEYHLKICQDCKIRPVGNEYGVCKKCFENYFG